MLGADGVAILAGRPATDDDTEDVLTARRSGYALSVGALQPGAIGVAAPIGASDWATASIGIVQLGVELADESLPQTVMAAAADATRRLSGDHVAQGAAR
jgi:DNA-binding IclR family transcriptional regulator